MCPDLLPVESYMVSGREGMFVQLQQRGFFFPPCRIGLWLLLKATSASLFRVSCKQL